MKFLPKLKKSPKLLVRFGRRHSFRLPKLPTLAYASFTSLLIFGLAFFISYGNNQKQPSNAETGDTINITAAGNLTLNLESTPIGNMATVSDQVTVTHKIRRWT